MEIDLDVMYGVPDANTSPALLIGLAFASLAIARQATC